MNNVIPANFDPEFKKQVFTLIKYRGVARAEKALLSQEIHPAFAKAIIRNIMRTMGW